ncbi:hypothetical protein EJ06DRAFT_578742 [Trichodelitschia bisporula]|uniref:HAD-like protein n=1 Tax=Trichodelitschia bisporula TaxID=703511 RepID=A0A6G1IBB7_9PEZI|nr:hypothetical protein EJ06DRAFT_578742 [Trichodelitschia bisporula]
MSSSVFRRLVFTSNGLFTNRLHPPLRHRNIHFHPSPLAKMRVHVFIDWDGTITEKDTMHVVAELGYSNAADANDGKPWDEQVHLRPWDSIVKAYAADLKAHTAAYTPRAEDRHTIEQEHAWLESLRPVELRSIRRVEKAQIFNNVHRRELRAFIRHLASRHDSDPEAKIKLRDGWYRLFVPHRWKIDVLSVNWSADFIHTFIAFAFQHMLPDNAQKNTLRACQRVCKVIANEFFHFPTFANGRTTGRLFKQDILTSADKQRVIREERIVSSPDLIVYVGDSVTDFGALLEADIGIIFRDEPMTSSQKELAGTLERVGVAVKELDKLVLKTEGSEVVLPTCEKPVLYTVRDLEQIVILLRRCKATPPESMTLPSSEEMDTEVRLE